MIRNNRAQSIIEFTFTMVAMMLLFFGLVRVFRWAGMDLADRRYQHDASFHNWSLKPEEQLNPNFYKTRKIDAVFKGK